ncbi:PASTA domain-containing protein [Arthrobacter gengyunqii]|uniref:non-specific serine/threonine protein kinase n=1 Tax=Arthrobacter gengyunqii TaxID=2886940 RepID=A0A9X1S754_9MICC|nr:Stk1 family PASTA domain-containing Ser/Thr kinase [Arthrobacter gengyunqii]MCC3270583.1 PASTA domain-containing protein [Arthrobacter gengyunqii]UOY97372.1 PASTA domain-containing protein [Arthrobacter gengyunqii]
MHETVNDPLVGTVVDERYRVLSRIARGGMSTVYLATDLRLDRDVALKVLYPHLAADQGFLDRFEREAKSAARLSHPHVVGVLDQGFAENLAYLVMEYVPGKTLRELLETRTRLSPRLALALLDAVVDGLAAAHDAGLIHRDVKPENVLLADNGSIKIADFGLARAVSTSTNTGTLVGTVAYLAPELVTGTGADERSDVYSAGIMLYEMLTGIQPFSGTTPIQVAFQHVHSTVPAPSVACPGLAEDLDELVQWCTAPDPDNRPVDGRALLGELRHIRTSLSDDQLDFHCADSAGPDQTVRQQFQARSGTAAISDPDATAALPRTPDGATEIISTAGSASAAAGAYPTEVIRRSDNETSVFPAGSRGDGGRRQPGGPGGSDGTENSDEAGDDGAPQVPVPGSRAERRQARREFKASERQSSRDAHRPEVSLRRGRPRRRGALLVVLAVLLIAAAVFTGWFFGRGPGAVVTVPDVANVSREAAGALLSGEGLQYSTNEIHDEIVAAGLAVGTDPDAPAEIRRYQPVRLLISKGPELFDVPNVVQRTAEDATENITDAGLTVGAVTEEYSETVDAGKVISQFPAPDTQLRRDTAVNVVVSLGPAPVEVPSVVGKTEDEAVQILEDAGLTAEVLPDRVNSRDVPDGSVAVQAPASGLVDRGSAVTITLSKGPVMVQVPNVVRQSPDTARAQLEGLGFQVQVSELLGGLLGIVQSQDPAGGSMAPEGSVITLRVV